MYGVPMAFPSVLFANNCEQTSRSQWLREVVARWCLRAGAGWFGAASLGVGCAPAPEIEEATDSVEDGGAGNRQTLAPAPSGSAASRDAGAHPLPLPADAAVPPSVPVHSGGEDAGESSGRGVRPGEAGDAGLPARQSQRDSGGVEAVSEGAETSRGGGAQVEAGAEPTDGGVAPFPERSPEAGAARDGGLTKEPVSCEGGICTSVCHPLLCEGGKQRIAAGQYHSCVLLEDGRVKCWGLNDLGQLGQGDTQERGRGASEMGGALAAVELGARAVAIAAGADHTCALLEHGKVKCWGANDWGQLGLGDVIHRGTGAENDPGMGDALPEVDLGANHRAQAITAGITHTCALLDNGEVKCWGGNSRGQLGQGDQLPRGDGTPKDSGMGDALLPVQLGESALRLTAGAHHTCAVLESGHVKCWGEGGFGQLGRGERVNVGTGQADDPGMGLSLHHLSLGASAVDVTAGYNHTCALLQHGGVKCWGRNHWGQLGQGDTLDRDGGDPPLYILEPLVFPVAAVAVTASNGYHSCARFEDGTVRCWGLNKYGQLGYGDTLERGNGAAYDPWGSEARTPVQLGAQRISGVATGLLHTCFLLDDYRVKCCGSNIVGQLGYGDPFDRCNGDPDFPMGEELAAVAVD